MPFFVSEKVCNQRDLRGVDQSESCRLDYELLLENGGECKLWPSSKVSLEGIDPTFQNYVNNLKWYTCIPQIKKSKNLKNKVEKVCRCCCYPVNLN